MIEHTVNPLTQGMMEKLVDALPDQPVNNVVYQRLFIEAAQSAGWLILQGVSSIVDLPRQDVYRLYTDLSKVYAEANSLPNG